MQTHCSIVTRPFKSAARRSTRESCFQISTTAVRHGRLPELRPTWALLSLEPRLFPWCLPRRIAFDSRMSREENCKKSDPVRLKDETVLSKMNTGDKHRVWAMITRLSRVFRTFYDIRPRRLAS